MRFRSKGEITTYSYTETVTQCNGTVVSIPKTIAGCQSGEWRSMTDVVTPGFKKKSARGGLVFSPMERTHIIAESSPGIHISSRINVCAPGEPPTNTKSRSNQGYLFSAVPPSNPVNLTFEGSVLSEAVAAAHAAVMEPAVESLVELAELPKTINSLVRLAFSFRRRIFDVKSSRTFSVWYTRHFKKTVRNATLGDVLDFISARWLEYRYMFLPMYLTGKAIVDELNDKQPTPERQTYRAYARLPVETSHTEKLVSASYASGKLITLTTRFVEARAGVLVENVRRKPYTKAPGVMLTDLPSAAWELIPFSFVVDWFTNIGTFIAAHKPLVGCRKLGSWVTVEHVFIWEAWTSIEAKESTTWTTLVSDTTARKEWRVKRRVIDPAISVTALSPLRFVATDVGLTRLVDAAALIRQLTTKRS